MLFVCTAAESGLLTTKPTEKAGLGHTSTAAIGPKMTPVTDRSGRGVDEAALNGSADDGHDDSDEDSDCWSFTRLGMSESIQRLPAAQLRRLARTGGGVHVEQLAAAEPQPAAAAVAAPSGKRERMTADERKVAKRLRFDS